MVEQLRLTANGVSVVTNQNIETSSFTMSTEDYRQVYIWSDLVTLAYRSIQQTAFMSGRSFR